MNKKIRVDKWLWTVRIFKSRTMATKACKNGKVKMNDLNLKPSYLVSVGDQLRVHKNGFNLLFEVKGILKSRVSASLAEPCYDNLTPLEELNKYKHWFIGKGRSEIREKGQGRPTKRERREIDEFKEFQFTDLFNDDEND
jgi:ribosome-associated heat shock protein Hsp15